MAPLVFVQIVGPNGEKEYNQNDAVSGKFAFTATDAGAHKVCFINHGSVRAWRRSVIAASILRQQCFREAYSDLLWLAGQLSHL